MHHTNDTWAMGNSFCWMFVIVPKCSGSQPLQQSRCQGCSQGWEQQRAEGETGGVLPGVRRVIMSTMASLIKEGTFGTIRTIICWDQEDYIFHCSVPDEVSIRHYLSLTRLWTHEEVNIWSRLLTQTGSSGNIITVIIKCHEVSHTTGNVSNKPGHRNP